MGRDVEVEVLEVSGLEVSISNPTTFPSPVNTSSACVAFWYRSSGEGSNNLVTIRSSLLSSIRTTPLKFIFSREDGIVDGALPLNRNSNTAPALYKSLTHVTPPISCSGAA